MSQPPSLGFEWCGCLRNRYHGHPLRLRKCMHIGFASPHASHVGNRQSNYEVAAPDPDPDNVDASGTSTSATRRGTVEVRPRLLARSLLAHPLHVKHTTSMQSRAHSDASESTLVSYPCYGASCVWIHVAARAHAVLHAGIVGTVRRRGL